MTEKARTHVNERLYGGAAAAPSVPVSHERIDLRSDVERERKQAARHAFVRRAVVHVVVFCLSFIFTLGASVLAILLWVTPDNLFAVVLVGIVAAAIFVATFTLLRLIVIHALIPDQPKGDDPGAAHHTGKSVAYAFVGLIFAVLLIGLIAQHVGASSLL